MFCSNNWVNAGSPYGDKTKRGTYLEEDGIQGSTLDTLSLTSLRDNQLEM